MRLAQENQKLQKELKEMADRLEAAEQKKKELERMQSEGGQQ
jgi:cell shape-determining protein MreC